MACHRDYMNMKKNIAIIMFVTIFSKFFGFFREIALSYFYGASAVSDAYLIAQTIPNVIFAFIGTGLATTFIPIYNKVMKEKGDQEANRFVSNLVNVVLFLTTLIIAFVLSFTPQVVKLFASGFDAQTMSLAVLFTRISIFGIYFSGMIYIFNSYLQIKDNFMIPAMIAIPMNLVAILSFFIASETDDRILAFGIVTSFLVQLLFILPSVWKNKLRYKLIFNLRDSYLKEIIILSVPVIVGVSFNQLSTLIDKNIASTLAVGGISALNYADRINGFVQGLFVVPIITVIYPNLSKIIVEKNEEGLRKLIKNAMVTISLLVIPATIGIMVLAEPVVELLFLRGEFDKVASVMTSQALFYYAIGILGYAFASIFARVYYSFNDTKIPVINGAIGVTIDIILNMILSRIIGIRGLALSTSISSIIIAVLHMIRLKKYTQSIGFRDILVKMAKITFVAGIMAIATRFSFDLLVNSFSQNMSVLLSIAIGAAVYGIGILFMKLEEVMQLLDLVKRKLKRKDD